VKSTKVGEKNSVEILISRSFSTAVPLIGRVRRQQMRTENAP
jgi:hypothetical protein